MMAYGGTHATLVKDYDLVLPSDPALDADHSDFHDLYRKYRDTGDASHLPMRAGQEPTLWKMRHVLGEARQELLDEMSRLPQEDLERGRIPRKLQYRAARLALVGWRNLRNGEGGDAAQPRRDPGPGGHVMVTESTMEWLASLTPETYGEIPLSLGVVALEKLANPLSS